ncbi:MAG: trigger factor [Gemmatimonadetes bacterium]|nr:trigger factor [Gemmatimonadota bacterium]NNM05652.1 trigger factor [Gemmatimonadota bacterium]
MTTDSSNLRIELEEQDAWRRRLTVTVPAGTVQTEKNKIIQKLGGRLKLPGFRKGKIPANVVEQRFGSAIDQELLDKVIGEAYREALQAQSLEPISEGQVEKVEYEPRQDLTFSISFDIQPVFEMERLGGFTVQRPKVGVVDGDIDRVLDRLRDQAGVWKPVDDQEPKDGNLVSLEILRLEGGEPSGESRPYEIVLGDGEAIPEVEDAVRTLAVGQTGDFTVTFPDDFPDEDRRGEIQHLRITLQAQKEKETPELTDEFAKTLGDFENLETLTSRVREDLEREAEEQAEGAVRAQLTENLIEANPFEVPRSMAERYMDSVLGDTSKVNPEILLETKEKLRPEAEKAVKRILVVDRVAELESLKATEDEVDDRVQEIAEKNDAKPAKVYADLQKAGNLAALEREITEKKVFEFLKNQSTINQE